MDRRIYNGAQINFGGMDMLIILFVVLMSQVYTDDKTNQIVYLRYTQFTLCQLSHHKSM